ncbi:MAG: MFS transporter [Rhodospirillales bacterium]|nr:MFS transporter [Rhodospirillales bacterium]
MTESQSWWRGKVLIAMICGGLILSLSMGIRQTFGLFLEPMSHDLGWKMGVFSMALALQNLLWGATQPFAGAIADKFGSGKTLAFGSLIYAGGIVLMAIGGSQTIFTISAGLIVGTGTAALGFPIVLGAVGRLVPAEKRPAALGLVSAGGSFGQFIFAPISQGIIGSAGWWVALLALAGFAALAVPLASQLTGKAMDGSLNEAKQTLKEALNEAFAVRSYWLLIGGFFVCGFHVAFVAVHLPMYLITCNMPASLGATALALIGLFNIAGTFAAGYLGVHFPMKYVLSAIYLARALVFGIFFAFPVSELSVLIFSASLGFLWLGTVPLTSGIVARVFGPQYMATLFGVVLFSHQVGAFLGVWFGGFFFDMMGSYDIVWIMSVVLGLVAGIIHLPIIERPLKPLAA